MYVLNKRQINIINYLLQQNEFITVKSIAEEFGVSARTVRYDIEIIEDWLNINDATLVKIPKIGIMIDTNLYKNVLIEKLSFISLENRVLTEKERVIYIVLELLSGDEELSIADISTRLYLSRNTITKILNGTREFLKENGLELTKVNAKGFIVTGSEIKKRSLLLEIFTEILDINNVILAMNDENVYSELMDYCDNNFPKFKFRNIDLIYEEITKIESKFDFHLTDSALAKLTVYLIIMVSRNENHQHINYKNTEIRDFMEYKIALDIAKQLKDALEVEFLQEEIDYISNSLAEAEIFNTDESFSIENASLRFNYEIIDLARHVIAYTENELKVDLSEDNKLYSNLVFHLKSALGRIKNNNKIGSNYTYEIKSKFPLVFELVKESISKYKNKFKFSDDEIAHIALHIRAAYERNYLENYKSTALVVCQEGVSLLNIMVAKLQRNFPELKIIETCSIYDYEANKRNIDLVITTNSFKTKDTEVIKVSPFIENEDITKIAAKIGKLNKYKQIYKYEQIKDGKGGEVIMLENLVSVDMIRLGVEAKDWEEAIQKSAEPLLEFDKIAPEYVDNMINAVHELGPYIAIMPGIAFAHARPDETVKETCMSMITLKEPVNFGSKQNDPIEIVFTFGAKSGDDHLMALQDLAKFLLSEENVKFLKKEKDRAKIVEKLVNI